MPPNILPLKCAGDFPLYLAIKAAFLGLVVDMLQAGAAQPHLVEDALRETTYSVLHAAITARNQELVANMSSKYPDLVYSFDEFGRTALSYAAYIGFLEGVKYFLDKLPQEAFQLNMDGSFPIHSACRGGNTEVVDEFLRRIPNTKWLLNKKGQSILHVAAGSGKAKVVKYLLRHDEFDKLINMKDKDGNTALHLATMGMHAKVVYEFTFDNRVKLTLQNKQGFTAFDLVEEHGGVPSLEKRLTWLALRCACPLQSPHGLDDRDITSLTELQIHHHRDSEKVNIGKMDKYRDKLNTLIVVSTLIATITTFTGFNLPGSYNSSNQLMDQGLPSSAQRQAFQVFLLSNTAAFYCSMFAIITLFWAPLDCLRLYLVSLNFVLLSLAVSLSVTFMAGLFVVLRGLCDWVTILGLILGYAFLPVLLAFLIHFFFSQPSFDNKFVRYVSRVTISFMLLASDLRSSG